MASLQARIAAVVKPSIDYLLDVVFPSGNLPSSLESSHADRLVHWCHGAPGIALSRACLWDTALWDEQCADEIAIALDTMTRNGLLENTHLCCGNLGLTLIQEALCSGPWPIAEDLHRRCKQFTEAIKKDAIQRCMNEPMQLRCYVLPESNLLLPGFFSGLSGMGMALLDDPDSIAMTRHLASSGLFPS